MRFSIAASAAMSNNTRVPSAADGTDVPPVTTRRV